MFVNHINSVNRTFTCFLISHTANEFKVQPAAASDVTFYIQRPNIKDIHCVVVKMTE